MSGWVPFDAAGWPEVAALLPRPWPRPAAAFDMRWHADRAKHGGGRMPGRPFFCGRWGWTDWKVKALMRSPDWVDPSRQPTASEPPANRQPTASEPPAEQRALADNRRETASEPPANRQRTASRPPANRHARETTAPSQPPTPSPEDAVIDLAKRLGWLVKTPPKRARNGVRSQIRARVRDYSREDVEMVLLWATRSTHKRAAFLREQCGIDTLLKPSNFDNYLNFARAESRRQPAPAPEPAVAVEAQPSQSRLDLLARRVVDGVWSADHPDLLAEAERELAASLPPDLITDAGVAMMVESSLRRARGEA